MRTFNEFEKNIIRQLVKINAANDPNSNILTFISNTVLQDRGIEFIDKEKTLKIVRKFSDNIALTEIFEIIALFKYLESNHLIFKHSNLNTPFIGNFISKNITQEFANQPRFLKEYGLESVPTNVYDLLNDYKISFMVVGTELKSLASNNFVTADELQHQREIKIAKLSFGIALIALLFSFLSPLVFNTETKIDQTQIDIIRTDLHRINSSIDTLNFQTKKSVKVDNETQKKQ